MKFFSVMYQTSNSKGQELLAQRMVKWARILGHEAWVLTSLYHDGRSIISRKDVIKTEKGYMIYEKDPAIGIPTIRVDSSSTMWPPRRIFFRDFISTLRAIDKDIGIDFIVTHSTLWNGPEETSRWVLWKRLMITLGEEKKDVFYAHMSHYQPPDPIRYSPAERTYRIAWNSTVYPSIFRTANLIICLTSIEAEDMISMGARPEQIHIFPGGLDDEEASLIDKANPDLFLDRFKIDRDKIIISYLGTIEERKNPLAIVRVARALKDLRDVIFVIAGRPGDQWSQVIKESKNLPNVIITGEIDERVKASLIKSSYINIIMSRMEAFGLTQLEFMYGGVPVVTSAVYGQKWLVRDGVDGVHLRGPDDIEGAARVIRELVKDRERRDLMSRNARERAKDMLMSRLMKNLFERVRS
ncbi:MAG: glycosyltransferase family 4 protein [Sulfolobales archaeon]